MCGLVGVAGDLGRKEEDVFKTLLILDSLRGEHSTGVASIGIKKDVLIAKAIGDPFQLFETNTFRRIMGRKNFVLLGHNRFATSGSITRKNAHPFENDVVIGAHNGTLTNKSSLDSGLDFDVDSEALLHHIAKKGLLDALSIARGAYALTYYNKENCSINFVRNNVRPLFFTTDVSKKNLFWASEEWMLQAALEREKIQYNPIIDLPPLSWIKFEIPETYKDFELKPHERKITKVPESDVQKIHTHKQIKSPTIQSLPQSLSKKEVDTQFLGAIGSMFIVGERTKDSRGADYFFLKSIEKTDYLVRVYPHKDNRLEDKKGNVVSGTVIAARLEDNVLVYRVDINSIKQINIAEGILTSFFKEDIVAEEKDIRGNIILEKDFDMYHNTCSWCSDPLEYGKGNLIISKAGGQYCPTCQSDAAVQGILRY